MLIIRGVNVFPTQIEELMLSLPELSGHYLIEVSREGNLDGVCVTVELSGTAQAQVQPERRRELAARLQHSIKTSVGISVRVCIENPYGIPRSAGKACHVVDKRPREARTALEGSSL